MDVVIILKIKALALFVIAFLNFLLALLIWCRGKTKATLHLGIMALFSGIYSLTLGMIYFTFRTSPKIELFWSRATWIGVLMLPAFVTFLYYFCEEKKYLKVKSFLVYISGSIIAIFALFTSFFIEKTDYQIRYYFFKGETAGPLDILGRIYILICLIIILFNLLKYYFKNEGFKKLQLKYFLVGTVIYAGVGLVTTSLLPIILKETADYVEIAAYFSIFWVGFTTYTIFKKQLFEIKLILTELLVGLMVVISAILPFLVKTLQLRILTIAIFFLFCFIGYCLIKTTYKEIKKREEIEKLTKELEELNKTLEKKVRQRTKELRWEKKLAETHREVAEERTRRLEHFYNLTEGRELKMVELKEKIRELEEKLKKED